MSVQLATQDRWLELNDVLRELVAQGFISQDSAEQALNARRRHAAQSQMHPLEFIASQQLDDLSRPGKHLDLESLTLWLAQQAGQPYLRIDPLKINVAAITPLMSYAFAQRHRILAVAVDRDSVTVASAQPYVNGWEADLTHVLKLPIKRVVANPVDIQRFSVEFFRLAKSVSGASNADAQSGNLGNFEQLLNLGASDQEPDANDAHIVNIVDWLFQYAFQQRASDIHIEPRREQGTVRFRIDGVLHNVYQFPPQVTMAIVSRLKSLGRMNVAEKRKPQDGRVKTKTPDGGEVELRLSTLPTAFGEKMVMRIFDPEVLLKDFDQLGFSADDLRRWQDMTRQPNGIILVTGPTAFGQDHHALHHPEKTGDAGGQPVHHRRPDRDGRAGVQPDAGAAQHRPELCRRGACADAAGPGHHHDWRDPRSGNRRNGHSGRTDRASGAVDPAHQRRAQRHQSIA
ncbi:hypothetical protein ABIA53_005128 [Pseudomonas monsensis]